MTASGSARLRSRVRTEPPIAESARRLVSGLFVLAAIVALPPTAAATLSSDRKRDLDNFEARRAWADLDSLAGVLADSLTATGSTDSLALADLLDRRLLARIGQVRVRDPEILALAENVVRIRSRLQGDDAPATSASRVSLALILWNQNERERAAADVERALAAQENVLGRDHPDLVRTLSARARFAGAAGDYALEMEALQRALAIMDAHPGTPSPYRSRVLLDLSTANRRAGRFDEARRAVEEALEILEAMTGAASFDRAQGLHVLANLYFSQSRWAEAESVFVQALAILETTLGPDNIEITSTLKNLASCYRYTKGPAASRELLARALDIEERHLDPDDEKISNTLLALGSVVWELGDYTGARALHERVVAIREKVLGPAHSRYATALFELAGDLRSLGELQESKDLYERARLLWEKAHGPENLRVGWALRELANHEYEMGRFGDALELAERGLAIQEKAQGAEHLDVGYLLTLNARIRMKLGEAAAAESLFQRALLLERKILSPDHPQIADIERQLGGLRFGAGDRIAARGHFERARDMEGRVLGPDHPQFAGTRLALATLDRLDGRIDAAIDEALDAERIGRRHFLVSVSGFSERQALRFAPHRASGLDEALSAIAAENGPESRVRRVWSALIASRALVLDEMAERRHLAAALEPPEAGPLRAELEASSRRLGHLMVQQPGEGGSDAYRRDLSEARERFENAERALARSSRRFRSHLGRSHADLDSVSAALPPATALVSCVRFQTSSPAPGDIALDRYLAFVLPAGGGPAVAVGLGDAAAIDRSIDQWRGELSRGPLRDRPAASEQACRVAGEAVRRLVWDPVTPHLGPARRLFLVPDGALQLVNLAALPDGDRFLVEGNLVIHHLAAERDIVTFAAAAGAMPEASSLLVLGGADFDGAPAPERGEAGAAERVAAAGAEGLRSPRPACREFQDAQFEPLPASRQEAFDIADLWETATGRPAIRLTGSAASEDAVKRLAGAQSILHLATHGFFLPGSCTGQEFEARGFGRVRPAETPGAMIETKAAETTESPHVEDRGTAEAAALFLSGLAVSGANRRATAAPGADDGIITAGEISALDLSRVAWAVLSACDTGLGELNDGEGVFGLRRALQVAGVRTSILSLWSVKDEAARDWMKHLYRARLTSGLDTAAAVREASLRRLADLRAAGRSVHPFYWGGFVAAGDWR